MTRNKLTDSNASLQRRQLASFTLTSEKEETIQRFNKVIEMINSDSPVIGQVKPIPGQSQKRYYVSFNDEYFNAAIFFTYVLSFVYNSDPLDAWKNKESFVNLIKLSMEIQARYECRSGIISGLLLDSECHSHLLAQKVDILLKTALDASQHNPDCLPGDLPKTLSRLDQAEIDQQKEIDGLAKSFLKKKQKESAEDTLDKIRQIRQFLSEHEEEIFKCRLYLSDFAKSNTCLAFNPQKYTDCLTTIGQLTSEYLGKLKQIPPERITF